MPDCSGSRVSIEAPFQIDQAPHAARRGIQLQMRFFVTAIVLAGSLSTSFASPPPPTCATPSSELSKHGLVVVQELVPDLIVRLKYASAANFMKEAVYGEGRDCYLQKDAAQKLALAQAALTKRRPGFSLLLGDCLRPRDVQRRMWSLVVNTPMQNYVARPDPGSMHNHGAAVDISIADAQGEALDMGTAFDHFGPLAQPRFEARYLREGKLTAAQVANRELLREVMTEAGWRGIRNEWWHFEAFSIREIRKRFPIVEAWPTEATCDATASAAPAL